MSCGYTDGKRVRATEGDGSPSVVGLDVVSFDGWHGLNEHEQLAAKSFEEGIENTLAGFPPSLFVDPSADNDDLVLTLVLNALGDGDNGPVFEFSLKDALADMDCYEEDKACLLHALETMVALVKGQIDEEQRLCEARYFGDASAEEQTP